MSRHSKAEKERRLLNRESIESLKQIDLAAWREQQIREAHQRFMAEKARRQA